ncbi:helix-turn-helix transcriptional regulator [Candidatus Poribacteria bacterium]|nr:helix-turn-helix transcriptional regulator [Candidatus Poribacteria bacterium]
MSSSQMVTEYRKRMKLTQERLADKINVSRQTIAMWETAKQFPSDHVAILVSRVLGINEGELMDGLCWDRLHQRIDQLEKQYNAKITIKRKKEKKEMAGLLPNATQTIDDVTLTVTQIYKSIYWVDPTENRSSGVIASSRHGLRLYHTDERLIVHLLRQTLDGVEFWGDRYYIEDNLGNQFTSHGSAGEGPDAESAYQMAASYSYSPEATSFTLRYDTVKKNEAACDALLFANVPIDGQGITQTFNDDIITYNGVHYDERIDRYEIHLAHNIAREVRHVGIAAITDDLGNHHDSNGMTSWGDDRDTGTFFEKVKVNQPDSNATSISFKYLFARTILPFEFRDLPLPS